MANCRRLQSIPLAGVQSRQQAKYHHDAGGHSFTIWHAIIKIMTIREAQEAVDSWIKKYGVRYFSELTNMAVLTEEVGELARVMARRYGDQSFKAGETDNLDEEMADVLWVLICLANQTGVDLTAALQKSIEKKTNRDALRHIANPKLKA
jgi:NTP pyrophosphatase (non-canonical NTP hydrolase)